MSERQVTLRDEVDGRDRRRLSASLEGGDLVLEGQDLGPKTAPVSDDGEYEWWRTVRARDVPALIAALGGSPGEEILDLLARVATGDGSYALEQMLRDGVVPSHVEVW